MRLLIVLYLVTLSYHAESKWDHPYDRREQSNGLEHTEYSNGPEHREQEHTIQRKDDHNRPNRRDNEWVNYRRDNRDYQLAHRKGNKKEQDWSNKREINNAGKSIHRYTADPPDHTKLIPMARYVIHNADWASIATISTLPAIEGFPFSNVKSMVDGYIANSTGIPYFYISPLDFTARDLSRNTRATVLATLEETKYCAQKDYDAEDPRCTRIMLSGKMKKVKQNSTEYEFAKEALFERHPSMANFPADHDFYVAKLKIAQIAMVDWFGGAKYIPVRDYLAYNYTEAQVVREIKRSHEVTVELKSFT